MNSRMFNSRDLPPEYVTERVAKKRLELATDPFIGEVYINAMEDYRWWGSDNKYSKDPNYFRLVRARELSKDYRRAPFKEFMEIVGKPGDDEAWTVLEHPDIQGNVYRAYPPGVDPPDLPSDPTLQVPNSDQLKIPEDIEEQRKLDRTLSTARRLIDTSRYLDMLRETSMETFVEDRLNSEKEYLSGEAIVPDLKTVVEEPFDPRFKPMDPSPYSAIDRLQADTIFAPKQVYSDLNMLEQGTSPVSNQFRASNPRFPSTSPVDSRGDVYDNTSHLDRAASFANKVSLQVAYERSLFTHHVACLIAEENGLPLPHTPLPDPRLSKVDIFTSRKNFSDFIATLADLQTLPPATLSSQAASSSSSSSVSSPLSSTPTDPLATQQYYSKTAAFVLAGIEKGLLPSDPSSLPLPFQEALARYKRAEYIAGRAKSIALTEQGREFTKKTAAEIKAEPSRFIEPPVHWNDEGEIKFDKPRVLEQWEKPQVSTTSTTGELSSLAAPSSLPSSSEPQSVDISKPIWVQDAIYELKKHGRHTEASQLDELFQNVARQHESFLLSHPLPSPPQSQDVDSMRLYELSMTKVLDEREQNWRQKLSSLPTTLLPLRIKEAIGVVNVTVPTDKMTATLGLETSDEPSLSPKLRPIKKHAESWVDRLVNAADEKLHRYHKELSEFLEKDVLGLTTMDEVRAFAERYWTGPELQSFIEQFRPLHSLTRDELVAMYGEPVVSQGSVALLDRNQRVLRADKLVEGFNRYWYARDPSRRPKHMLDELEMPTFKSTRQLNQEMRQRMDAKKALLFEHIQSFSPEQLDAVTGHMREHDRHLIHQVAVETAMRDKRIIESDPEFKYLSSRPKWAPTLHQPHGLITQGVFSVLAPITYHLYQRPKAFIHRNLLRLWAVVTMQTPTMQRHLLRVSGLDMKIPISVFSDLRLDPATTSVTHNYYRNTLYRLHYFFNPPEGVSPTQTFAQTESWIPTWFEWRLREFRLGLFHRMNYWASGPNFWWVPAFALTALGTYAMLEQRNTWAHDLLRTQPAGLEWSINRRRAFIQNCERIQPNPFKRARVGPTAFWLGPYEENPLQNTPWLHKTNSSNARDFKAGNE